MTIFAALILTGFLTLLTFHLVLVTNITSIFKSHETKQLEDSECPKAVICLNLRGFDPFLATVLPALLDQDYPGYDVIIVVDHRDDPAFAFVENFIRASNKTNIKMCLLNKPMETCSLVNSALIQTLQKNLNNYEVVAMIDADTVPHKTWLRELLAPLRDKKIGAVSGQRWYFPPSPHMGDLVRYIWNIPAVLQMIYFRILWGGSLAIRMDVLKKCDVLDYYEKSLVQDVPLHDVLKKHGYSIHFAPSILMINRESVNLSSLIPWIQRQLLWAILYHSSWWKIVIHGIMVTLVPISLASLITISFLLENLTTTILGIISLGCYGLISLFQLIFLERLVRKIIKKRGEPTEWLNPLKIIAFIPALFLTQLVYPKALLSALISRKIEWRGIHYQIDSPFKVKMLNYEPYKTKEQKNKNYSL